MQAKAKKNVFTRLSGCHAVADHHAHGGLTDHGQQPLVARQQEHGRGGGQQGGTNLFQLGNHLRGGCILGKQCIEGSGLNHHDVNKVIDIRNTDNHHGLNSAVTQTGGQCPLGSQAAAHDSGCQDSPGQLKQSGGGRKAEGVEQGRKLCEPGQLWGQQSQGGQTNQHLGNEEAQCADDPCGDDALFPVAQGVHKQNNQRQDQADEQGNDAEKNGSVRNHFRALLSNR